MRPWGHLSCHHIWQLCQQAAAPHRCNAPPVRSDPQLCHRLHTLRGLAFRFPHLEELLAALTDYSRASQAAEDLQNQLLALRLEQHPGNAWRPKTDRAAELPGALQRRGQRGAEKGKGSAQDRAGSRRLCPKCSKAPRHSLPGSEGSQTWAPPDAAAPRTGREGAVGERCPAEDRAKRQQGQKRAAAAQQSQRVCVCGSTIRIPLFRHAWLPP